MADRDLPAVSVLVPAYNYERYVAQALESALLQDYPAECFEIVVVDDGSTDRTASIVSSLAESNPGRIKLIHQENSGQIATVARARAAAGGALLALLDADDVWLPSKLRRQVELFQQRPEVALVFCDMHTIGEEGKLINRSQYGDGEPDLSRLYARVLRSNVVYNSSLVIRAELFREPPGVICDWDWWLALCAGERGEYGYISEPLALYRLHGENMLYGAAGRKLVTLRRRQLRFQRWTLRNMNLDSLSPRDLIDAWGGAEWFAETAAQAVDSHFVDLVSVSDDDRAEALSLRREAERARGSGDLHLEAQLLLRALACDPQDPDASVRFNDAAARANAVPMSVDPLAGARPFVVVVDANELLDGDDMVFAYAAAMSGAERATLVVDASQLVDTDVVTDLQALIARCGLAGRTDIDVVAVVDRLDPAQQRRMHAATRARYVRSLTIAANGSAVPTFTPASIAELRRLADAGG